MNQIKLAWLAGMIDGDGSIVINRSSGTILRAQTCIVNTNKLLVDEVTNIYKQLDVDYLLKHYKAPNKKWKDSYHIVLNTKDSNIRILTLIFKYLISKKEQAKIAIKFCKRVNYKKRFSEINNSDLLRIAFLNKKGK